MPTFSGKSFAYCFMRMKPIAGTFTKFNNNGKMKRAIVIRLFVAVDKLNENFQFSSDKSNKEYSNDNYY